MLRAPRGGGGGGGGVMLFMMISSISITKTASIPESYIDRNKQEPTRAPFCDC